MQPHAKRSLRVTSPKCDTHTYGESTCGSVCVCVCASVYGGVNYAQLKWLLGSAFKFVTRFEWVANKCRA